MSDQASEKQDDSQPEKGGIGLVGMLVLGVACAATSFASVYFLAPAQTVVAEASSGDAEPAEYAAAPDKDSDKKDFTYTPIQEILITIGNAPATRYLKMNVSLATSKSDARKIKSSETALVDAFLLYLRSVSVDDFEDPSFYKHMREQLTRRADLVLGDGVSEGVLITEFLLR